MNEEKIKELFSDEAFVNSILEMETPEAVQKALSDKGVELSLEEINSIKDFLYANEGELSEADLENVAGGVSAQQIGYTIGKVIDQTASAIYSSIKNSRSRKTW